MEKPEEDLNFDYKVKDISCPACGFEEAKFITHLMDIPYYEDFLMVNINCSKCGFRTSDFYNTKSKGYIKHVYRVKSIDDASTKIVRSSTGIVSIPELGIKIEPVNDGSSWIRNIEGILDDVRNKLLIMLRDSDEEQIRLASEERINQLETFARNDAEFTIIIEDETGNSIILPARVENLREFSEPDKI